MANGRGYNDDEHDEAILTLLHEAKTDHDPLHGYSLSGVILLVGVVLAEELRSITKALDAIEMSSRDR
jgi:hypothetical protein